MIIQFVSGKQVAFNPKHWKPNEPGEFQFVNLASGYTSADSLNYCGRLDLCFKLGRKAIQVIGPLNAILHLIGEFMEHSLKFFAKLDYVNKTELPIEYLHNLRFKMYVFWDM